MVDHLRSAILALDVDELAFCLARDSLKDVAFRAFG